VALPVTGTTVPEQSRVVYDEEDNEVPTIETLVDEVAPAVTHSSNGTGTLEPNMGVPAQVLPEYWKAV
jgi:hypothetical protein